QQWRERDEYQCQQDEPGQQGGAQADGKWIELGGRAAQHGEREVDDQQDANDWQCQAQAEAENQQTGLRQFQPAASFDQSGCDGENGEQVVQRGQQHQVAI